MPCEESKGGVLFDSKQIPPISSGDRLERSHIVARHHQPLFLQRSLNTHILGDCQVCGQPAHGSHFGVLTCRACAAFFRLVIVYNDKNCGNE
ncbi:hypothetical protein DICVIV_13135 [Dictyocaulus viviparus]|uniref:Nuclear receptor domain-containing protein n=1 Tax=Dictyocaulus viviparus TaxID=29172 RepID=A0A0D8X8M9_DICVI|nr:hypothetical protein DICVIV_13135 [Dictyocaulus viviparus]